MVREKLLKPSSGWSALVIGVVLGLIALGALATGIGGGGPVLVLVFLVALVGALIALTGLFFINPNEARVLQLFGEYVGTVREAGFCWANPFYSKRRVSLRMVSIEVGKLKVNDLDGNPVEIAAIVVWKVTDSAQAVFEVDNYPEYVRVQGESAVRTLASRYPYDAHDDATLSLRGNTQQVAEHLQQELDERVNLAGVKVLEARISHLAYAPEIAQAMLQRQQAGAIIAARQKIVDGAVGMVEMALERLSRNNVVVLDEERKAAMVSNLLVVLCSERSTQPIVNTGSLY
jgi:regulator of protease activity HflC (stomatin/prohibitin superfamily)